MLLIIVTICLYMQTAQTVQSSQVVSRQKFSAEFLDNLKKENRVRFGKSVKFFYSDVAEDLFSVYDPSFLAHLWPKLRTGVHLNIGHACWDDLSVFFKDLTKGRTWAYSAVDASGRYVPGLFEGNNYWLGSKQECFQLESAYLKGDANDTLHDLRNGDYLNSLQRQAQSDEWSHLVEQDELIQRVVAADKVPPFRMSYITARVLLDVTKPTLSKSYAITLGVCVPRSCTFEDMSHVLDFSIMINDHMKTNKTAARTVKITTIKRIDASYDAIRDAGAIVLILFTVLLILLVIIATVVDLELVNFRAVNAKSMSFNLERPAMDNRLSLETLEAKRLDVLSNEKKYKTLESLSLPKTHCCVKNNQANKNINVVDMETLTINNINNSNQINLVTVKKIMKPDAKPPSITLDVVAVDDNKTGSCRRCGKYRKQCSMAKETDFLSTCPRVNRYNTYEAVSVKDEDDKCKRKTFFKSLLLCFSLSYSIKRIFNTNMANRDLCAMHILKIVSTFWMIFLHVCLIVSYLSDNGGELKNNYSIYNIFHVGTFAFDTLFFISGVLSAHHFFYLKGQYTTKELVSFGGAFGKILQFICFVTNRAIRLLPSYMYVMFLGAFFARRHQRTAVLELPEDDYDNCDKYWWRNLLYVNTFYDNNERCMQWSWYLSAETQLHAVGMLWLSVFGRWRLALLMVTTFLAAMVTGDVVVAIREYGASAPNTYAVYQSFIERVWARPAPYFVGLFTGWMVHRLDGQLKLGKMMSVCLWTSSVVVMTSLLVRPWSAHALGPTVEIVLSSLSHSFWAVALSWPAVVFATQSAGWSRRVLNQGFVAALSRLSYGVFLLHGVIVRMLILNIDRPLSYDTATLITYFVCTTVLSIIGSFVLSVLVETPCCSLLRRLTDCTNT